MPQRELAERLEISNSYLSEIEKGHKQPNLELLRKYSTIFSLPLSSIVFFAEEIETPSKSKPSWLPSKILAILEFVDARTSEKDN
jgi:transcriptional regulator with XRE-family HTH domain